MVKQNRGRMIQPRRDGLNAEPTYLPEPPSKLVFGQHQVCSYCKGKGKKGGRICRGCSGTGVTQA